MQESEPILTPSTEHTKESDETMITGIPDHLRSSEGNEPAVDQAPPTPMIEVPDGLLSDEQMQRIAAETATNIVKEEGNLGRSGMGVIPDVPMPADPSKVPGWEGDVRR